MFFCDEGPVMFWLSCLGCSAEGPAAKSEALAIDAWNTRATNPLEARANALGKLVEEMRLNLVEQWNERPCVCEQGFTCGKCESFEELEALFAKAKTITSSPSS